MLAKNFSLCDVEVTVFLVRMVTVRKISSFRSET